MIATFISCILLPSYSPLPGYTPSAARANIICAKLRLCPPPRGGRNWRLASLLLRLRMAVLGVVRDDYQASLRFPAVLGLSVFVPSSPAPGRGKATTPERVLVPNRPFRLRKLATPRSIVVPKTPAIRLRGLSLA